MIESVKTLSCAEFQAQLPDLIGSGANISSDPHVRTCKLCSALIADLDAIALAARQLFQVEEPPDELWRNIESAIVNEGASPGR